MSRFTITIPRETLKINFGFTKTDFQPELPPGTRVIDRATRPENTIGSPPGR